MVSRAPEEWSTSRRRTHGLISMMDVPGADPIQIYQPKHDIAYKLK